MCEPKRCRKDGGECTTLTLECMRSGKDSREERRRPKMVTVRCVYGECGRSYSQVVENRKEKKRKIKGENYKKKKEQRGPPSSPSSFELRNENQRWKETHRELKRERRALQFGLVS